MLDVVSRFLRKVKKRVGQFQKVSQASIALNFSLLYSPEHGMDDDIRLCANQAGDTWILCDGCLRQTKSLRS